MRNALIIVDVQNDFCPGGALAVPGGDEVIAIINSVSDRFDTVVATRDWHPVGHVSFASTHPGRQIGEIVNIDAIDQALWPDHCVQGAPGADFHPALDLRPVDLIVHKGTSPGLDSYSAFLETDRTTETGLRGYLAGLGIGEVTVCGLATDYCVYFTAIDAIGAGLRTTLLTDACRGIDLPEGNLERAMRHMIDSGVTVATSADMPRTAY